MENKEKLKKLLKKYHLGTITEEEMELMSTIVDIESFNKLHDDADDFLIYSNHEGDE